MATAVSGVAVREGCTILHDDPQAQAEYVQSADLVPRRGRIADTRAVLSLSMGCRVIRKQHGCTALLEQTHNQPDRTGKQPERNSGKA